MAEIKFKELEFDNVFDFCEVINAIGAEEVLSSVNPKEIAAMSERGKNAETIGVMVAMKFGGILVKNFPKARNEIYSFFAGCTKWDNGKDVEIEEIKHLKPSAAVRLIKDFTKLEDISDFFKEVSSLLNMDQEVLKNC
nr:MAG TPA: hypothetical protein [Bacteriophage sp.]